VTAENGDHSSPSVPVGTGGLKSKYRGVEFRRGLPNLEDFDSSQPVLLIVDDLMNRANEEVANMFAKGSHHRNASVVFLEQNH